MRSIFLRVFFLLGIFLFLPFSQSLARDLPKLTGPVVDEAKALSEGARNQLDSALRDFREKTGNQFQILIIPSLEGDVLEDFSIRVAEKWKIGDAKTDRGLIMLLAMKEHAARIEVGQGLEGEIPDAFAGRVINDIMVPQFREGKFDQGVMMGIMALSERVGAPIKFAGVQASQPRRERGSLSIFDLIFVLLFLIFFIRNPFLTMMFFGGRGRGGSGGGFSSGGGSWGGGGGGFSGGGASGRW